MASNWMSVAVELLELGEVVGLHKRAHDKLFAVLGLPSIFFVSRTTTPPDAGINRYQLVSTHYPGTGPYWAISRPASEQASPTQQAIIKSMSGGRGGRRRSPIWEHFLLGKNADGNRVAQCTFCSRVMKSQPDRMENHFLKLCAQVDMDARRRWLLDRENRETISALQRQRDEALGKLEDTMGTNSSNSVLSLSGAGDDTASGSLQAQVVVAAAAGDTHSRQQQQLFKIAEVSVDHVLDDPELSTASPVPTKVRKMAAGKVGGSAAKKQQQQFIPQQQQQQQQRNNGGNPHFSILKDVNGKTERVELENLGLMRAAEAGGLDAQMLELQKRKLEIEERKSHLQIESMRYDNDIKRIKVAEENMLARKRLRDAGVPLEEIDLLLPLQKPEMVDFQSL